MMKKSSAKKLLPIFSTVFILLFFAVAYADTFEDGKAAFDRRDYQSALQIWKPLAAEGNVNAQIALGDLYFSGPRSKSDFAEAIRFYRAAADQGSAKAAVKLGHMYAWGLGANKDYAEALRWYHLGAERGSLEAETEIGTMYLAGAGLKSNKVEARKWFSHAAKMGNGQAQWELAEMTENQIEASFWAMLAAKAGAPPHEGDGKTAYDYIVRLGKDQLPCIQSYVDKWTPGNEAPSELKHCGAKFAKECVFYLGEYLCEEGKEN